jgi:predicted nuclease with TOPRIM domain
MGEVTNEREQHCRDHSKLDDMYNMLSKINDVLLGTMDGKEGLLARLTRQEDEIRDLNTRLTALENIKASINGKVWDWILKTVLSLIVAWLTIGKDLFR